jgi:hypothetical protein
MLNSDLLARAVTAILSWLDAANLRNRVYQQQQQLELLTLAIEDIQRINQRSSLPDPLIDRICQQAAGLNQHS